MSRTNLDAPSRFPWWVAAGSLARGVGKIVTWRHLEESMTRGIELVDWGCGDSGYKRTMGAEPGAEVVDCLFVRGAALAALLRPLWKRSGR